MTPERWQRLEAVLRGAIDLDAETRDRYLQDCCGDDEELRREAESLLAFEPHADTLILGALQAAVADFEDDDPALTAGERLGDYRIVREIGRGGMGTVYLAERDDKQFQKQVAIKVVTHGMSTEQVLRRFRRERRSLFATFSGRLLPETAIRCPSAPCQWMARSRPARRCGRSAILPRKFQFGTKSSASSAANAYWSARML